MPPPRRKPQPPGPFHTELGSAAGASIADFHVLAHSTEYDEAFERTNPPTFQSPTSRFTHVFHYQRGVRDRVHRLTDRLLTLWQSPAGEALTAGFPRGVFEVTANGLIETIFKGHDGVFTGLWGPSSAHVFACGMGPFALLRENGRWRPLALPGSPCTLLHAIFGFSEQDVYFVGDRGTILHYDGRDFVVLEVPTTHALRRIAPLGRHVCVAGEDGILLHGSKDGWRQVPTGADGIIDGLASWRGQVFFGTLDGVWCFDGTSAPTLVSKTPAEKVSGFPDGLLVKCGYDARLWDGAVFTSLDTVL